jgi:hypothetical protein
MTAALMIKTIEDLEEAIFRETTGVVTIKITMDLEETICRETTGVVTIKITVDLGGMMILGTTDTIQKTFDHPHTVVQTILDHPHTATGHLMNPGHKRKSINLVEGFDNRKATTKMHTTAATHRLVKNGEGRIGAIGNFESTTTNESIRGSIAESIKATKRTTIVTAIPLVLEITTKMIGESMIGNNTRMETITDDA